MMGKLLAAFVLCSFALACCHGAEEDQGFYNILSNELKKQQAVMEGQGLHQLAAKFMEDAREIGREFVGILKSAVKAGTNGTEDVRRAKRDTAEDNSIQSILNQLMEASGTAADTKSEDASLPVDTDKTNSVDANSSQDSKTRAGSAPIVLIPGPPGPPGLPGIPGLPGVPGKLPNFKGLKAIITTRVAELLAFLATIFVLILAKFLGLLGLFLGLVLPIYGKLKSSGIYVPDEQQSSYGGYNRRKRSLPMTGAVIQSQVDELMKHVHVQLDRALASLENYS